MTISVFGKRGVGKSSTLNTLFGLNFTTDSAEACTKEASLKLIPDSEKYHYEILEVVDLPGIGEGFGTDDTYMPFYEDVIPKTDTLLWITQANVRAYKHDQIMFKKIAHMLKPDINFVFGVNKSDILITSHFNLDKIIVEDLLKYNGHQIFQEKIDDILSVFSKDFNKKFLFDTENICFYSSHFNWNTEILLSKILKLN